MSDGRKWRAPRPGVGCLARPISAILLVKDALLRVAEAADTIGARALLVHAEDEDAKGFYEHCNFEPSRRDPYHLLLIMKDLMRIVET